MRERERERNNIFAGRGLLLQDIVKGVLLKSGPGALVWRIQSYHAPLCFYKPRVKIAHGTSRELPPQCSIVFSIVFLKCGLTFFARSSLILCGSGVVYPPLCGLSITLTCEELVNY